MVDTITINQQLTLSEFFRSTLYFYLSGPTLKRFFILLLSVILLSTLLGLATTSTGISMAMVIGTIAPILFLLAMVMVFTFLFCLYVYKGKSFLFNNVAYDFNHWGVSRHGEQTQFSKPWREITGYKETRAFFLLYVGKTDFHIIQKRMITGSVTLNEFRNLLQQKITQR